MRLTDGLEVPGAPKVPVGFIRVAGEPLAPWEHIRMANSTVSIVHVLRAIGVDTPELSRGSIKVHCPFGEVWHGDGGNEQALRVYEDTNTSFCFACTKLYTPTALHALTYDISESDAAEILLNDVAPQLKENFQNWDKLMKEHILKPDTFSLVRALEIYCSTIREDWFLVQFDENISVLHLKCLALLDRIQSAEDAADWLRVSKEVMSRILIKD